MSGTRKKDDYEARMESIKAGREGREFGSRKGKEDRGSLTNKVKAKRNKAFMMLVHKRDVKLKATRSLREKQQILRKHIKKQKMHINPLKIIAASTIPKYLVHFPDHADRAYNAQLDLCEDDVLAVRREAIRNLVVFCNSSPSFVRDVADVLCQLLQAGTQEELVAVHTSFKAIILNFSESAFEAIFHQLMVGSAEVCRVTLNFLIAHYDVLKLTPQIETELFQATIKVIERESVGSVVLDLAIKLLKVFKALDKKEMHSPVLSALEKHVADMLPFDLADRQLVAKLLMNANAALPVYKAGASSAGFLQTIFENFILNKDFDKLQHGPKLNLLKMIADLTPFMGMPEYAPAALQIAENALIIADSVIMTIACYRFILYIDIHCLS
eukprot:jgi/Hompol1/352/HPOL_002477-RA